MNKKNRKTNGSYIFQQKTLFDFQMITHIWIIDILMPLQTSKTIVDDKVQTLSLFELQPTTVCRTDFNSI